MQNIQYDLSCLSAPLTELQVANLKEFMIDAEARIYNQQENEEQGIGT